MLWFNGFNVITGSLFMNAGFCRFVLPVTFKVPPTIKFASASTFLLIANWSAAFSYTMLALAPAIVIPAPSAWLGFTAPLANVMFLSSIVNVAVFTLTTFPCTSKSPETVKLLTWTLAVANAAKTLVLVKYRLLDTSITFAVVNPVKAAITRNLA